MLSPTPDPDSTVPASTAPERLERARSQAQASLRRAIACWVVVLVTGLAAFVLGIIGPEEGIGGPLRASKANDPARELSLHFSLSDALLQGNGKALVGLALGTITVVVFVLTGGSALIFGMGSFRNSKEQPRAKGALAGIVTASAGMLAFCALMVAVVPNLFQMAQEARSARNLWTLTLAMLRYHDTHNQFPPASFSHADFFEVLQRIDPAAFQRFSQVTKDFPKARTPLLSWRVLILPYLPDESSRNLFKEFHLHESWDSPHNIALLPKMPQVFAGAPTREPFSTNYQVLVGREALFQTELKTSLGMHHITDGTSNTILMVEAHEAVPWTKPQDLDYDPNQALPKLGVSSKGFCAAFADLGIYFIHKDYKEPALRAAITPRSRDEFDWKDLRATKLIPSPKEWPDVVKYFEKESEQRQ